MGQQDRDPAWLVARTCVLIGEELWLLLLCPTAESMTRLSDARGTG